MGFLGASFYKLLHGACHQEVWSDVMEERSGSKNSGVRSDSTPCLLCSVHVASGKSPPEPPTIKKLWSRVWWCKPITPELSEDEAGGSQVVQAQLGLNSNLDRLCLKIRKQKMGWGCISVGINRSMNKGTFYNVGI